MYPRVPLGYPYIYIYIYIYIYLLYFLYFLYVFNAFLYFLFVFVFSIFFASVCTSRVACRGHLEAAQRHPEATPEAGEGEDSEATGPLLVSNVGN